MTPETSHQSGQGVPPRALVLSFATLLIPVAGGLLVPETLGEAGALLWLVALIPAFLLSYYKGWRGVATALAMGMVTLVFTQILATLMARPIPDLLLWIVVAYLAIALAIGWVTEALHRQRADVEDLALTDLLTHLPNRRHARVFLENEFGAAERGRRLSIVLFDLDHFKEYNDTLGHQAGDEALRRFGEILASTTRRMNLSSRFGGEEFLTVLAGSDEEGALIFAERVREALQGLRMPGRSLTVSAGVATYHPSMRSPDELIAAADLALYRAKRDGRNCVRVFGRPLDSVPQGSGEALTWGESGDGPSTPPSEYPRPDEDIGRTRPAVTLLPHQITKFGSGREVLVVEDEGPVRALIATYLQREGFTVFEAGDAIEGIRALGREFDVVITDIRLPGPTGNDLVAALKSRWPRTQVIVITGFRDAQVAAAALNAGADRYLFKPFGMPELQAHLVDALARRDRLVHERREKAQLSEEARRREEEARAAILRGAHALVAAVEVRDLYTRGHSARVARYSRLLLDHMEAAGAPIDPQRMELACELHDVGKIGISDTILNKTAPLTAAEYEEVQKHPKTGRRILEPLLGDELVLSVVSWHHERWDGTGYPDGLSGEAIPLAARVVAVADALDAMTSSRAYRAGLPWDDALEQIVGRSGTQFDPRIVEAMERALPLLREIHQGSHAEAP